MKKLLLMLIFSIFVLSGCSEKKSEPLKISISSWIGYTPLYYVHAKGYVRDRIKFYNVVSLTESMKMYQSGLVDSFCGTQYEMETGGTLRGALVPVMLLSRSDGADSILASQSMESLKNYSGTTDVYLETQTVNMSLFKLFTETYGLQQKKYNIINRDQYSISKAFPKGESVLIVTYEPYTTELMRKGFVRLSSTSDIRLLVLDSLITDKSTAEMHREDFLLLREQVKYALDVLKTNPREFYSVVKPFLGNISFSEFMTSLNGIKWIVDNVPAELLNRMRQMNFPYEEEIK